MKPLRVLLVHRDQQHRWERIDGQFAYEVPEFAWEHRTVDKVFTLDVNDCDGYDVVWWDEGKHRLGPHFQPRRGAGRRRPVAYYCLYPSLAGHMRTSRQKRARDDADLVLLDHDRLDLWRDVGVPAWRCAYSVDERRYRPLEKDIDVGFYCVWNYSPERPALNAWLEAFCERKGYRFWSNRGLVVDDYAELLGRTKVVLHLNRTPDTRPPRIFDVSAAGGVLVSNPMPPVEGENWRHAVHYWKISRPGPKAEVGNVAFREMAYTDEDCAEIAFALEMLLDGGRWEPMAREARKYVLSHHTWAHRARWLRHVFRKALGL